MARIRSVHPDALKSDKLAACSAEAERCYWRLQPLCDDAGRAEDDPVLLAATMFPKREDIVGVNLDAWLGELHDRGLIVRYEVDGNRYLTVVRWDDYQKPQKKVESRLPPLPEGYATPTRPLQEGVSTEVGGGGGVGGVVGEGEGVASSSPSASTRALATAEPKESAYTPRPLSLSEMAGLATLDAKGITPLGDLAEAFMAESGIRPRTKAERDQWDAALRELSEAHTTPDEMRAAVRAYRQKWPTIVLTFKALTKHMSALIAAGERPTAPPSFAALERLSQ